MSEFSASAWSPSLLRLRPEEAAAVSKVMVVGIDGRGEDVDKVMFTLEYVAKLLKFAVESKTKDPSIYLQAVAEALLLAPAGAARISTHLPVASASHLRDLFIQTLHGAAPERTRDDSLCCLLTLFSCRRNLDLDWTLEGSDGEDVNRSKKHGNFVRLVVDTLATELHVSIEELLFYLSSTADAASASGRARLDRCEKIVHLLVLGLEYVVQFLLGDADASVDRDQDEDSGAMDGEELDMDSDDEGPPAGPHGSQSQAVFWTNLPFTVIESIQAALHASAADLIDFLNQLHERKRAGSRVIASIFSRERESLLVRRLLNALTLLAEEDLEIFSKCCENLSSLLSFCRIDEWAESNVDITSLSDKEVDSRVFEMFGFGDVTATVSPATWAAWDEEHIDSTTSLGDGAEGGSKERNLSLVDKFVLSASFGGKLEADEPMSDPFLALLPVLHALLVDEEVDFPVTAEAKAKQRLGRDLSFLSALLSRFSRQKRQKGEAAEMMRNEADVEKRVQATQVQAEELLRKIK